MSRTIFCFSKNFFLKAIQWCEGELAHVDSQSQRAGQLRLAIQTFRAKCGQPISRKNRQKSSFAATHN